MSARTELALRVGLAAASVGMGLKMINPDSAYSIIPPTPGTETTDGPVIKKDPIPKGPMGAEKRKIEAAKMQGSPLIWESLESGEDSFPQSRLFIGPGAGYQFEQYLRTLDPTERPFSPNLNDFNSQTVALAIGEQILTGNATDALNKEPDSDVIRVAGVTLQEDGVHVRVAEYKHGMDTRGEVVGPIKNHHPGDLIKFDLPVDVDPQNTKVTVERVDSGVFSTIVSTISVALNENGEVIQSQGSVDVLLPTALTYLEEGNTILEREDFSKLFVSQYANQSDFSKDYKKIKGEDAKAPTFDSSRQIAFIAAVSGDNPSLKFEQIIKNSDGQVIEITFSSPSDTPAYTPEGLHNYIVGIASKEGVGKTNIALTYKGATEPFVIIPQ